MGLIYYKGNPYGGAAADSNDNLKFYAVEGDPDTSSGAIELTKTKVYKTNSSGEYVDASGNVLADQTDVNARVPETDENGKEVWKVEIPMGSVIENAFVLGNDEIETRIKELSNHQTVAANIGTRLKFGNVPQEGIIAGGLRIAKENNGVLKFYTSWGAYSTKATKNISNYIYTKIPDNDNIRYSAHLPENSQIKQFWEMAAHGTFSIPYFMSGTSLAIPWVLISDEDRVTIDTHTYYKITPKDGNIPFSDYGYLFPGKWETFGYIFLYRDIIKLEQDYYCTAEVAMTATRQGDPDGTLPQYDQDVDNKRDGLGYRNSDHRTLYAIIKMSEEEARYAMGVTDSFDQLSFEEWSALH